MATNNYIKEVAIKEGDLYRSEPSFKNKEIRMTLGIPLSINHMYVNTRRGGKTLSAAAERYIRDSTSKVMAIAQDEMWKLQKDSTWYYLDIVVYMPDRKVRDSHNMLKLLLDTLEGVVYTNDYYVMPRIQSVEYDKENPRVELILKPQLVRDRNRELKRFNS